MIHATITGTLYDGPMWRKTKAGDDYVTARILSAEPNRGYQARVAISAYQADAADMLALIEEGEAVCVTGQLWPRYWHDNYGQPQVTLSLTAEAVELLR